MKRKFLFLIIAVITAILSTDLSGTFSIHGQSRIIKDFQPVCDTLNKLILERTTIKPNLKVKAIMKRGSSLDFYFTVSLSDIPWSAKDRKWLISRLKEFLPPAYKSFNIGEIYTDGIRFSDIVTLDSAGNDGTPRQFRSDSRPDPDRKDAVVTREDRIPFPEGMDGRNIAVWQSHGLYYNKTLDRWKWQRPCLFQTVEDLFTQSFVLPFLVPMLENAGAYVMLPRERDFQKEEIIVDNDPFFAYPLSEESSDKLRRHGIFSKSGKWENAGKGFADTKPYYTNTDNPFVMGSALKASCIEKESGQIKASRITWTPEIKEKGEYAVYVSYKTLPNSSKAAHYTVYHAGGKTGFFVNQTMGGGTWIYLGTFTFDKGEKGYIELDNIGNSRTGKNAVVTADAVKIGGGYGNIARGPENEEMSRPSGLPRFAEGARYWLQWAGADSSIFYQNKGKDDYRDDFMSRGDWVAWMSGGSRTAPGEKGKGIPFDLSFALHSDAGVTPNDSTVGTLAIYTLKSEGKTKLPCGESRHTSREYANIVQTQIVNDLRALDDPQWNRRQLWNRGYRESRTPTCPAMLCELLSHQNFSDMKRGLDPAFRFTVSRAIYKGMLKYLSSRYSTCYTVQPLPVHSFSAVAEGDRIRLSWEERKDLLEPTADADGFILYTKKGNGSFDEGTVIKDPLKKGNRFYHYVTIKPGQIYSFRISAYNKGGSSFPSETLSAGLPHERKSLSDSCILIVNNFDRVSAPAWFDTPVYAGFDNRIDSGVPYYYDPSFCGEMYEMRRGNGWMDDDCPGHGASYNDKSGNIVAGNTFNYCEIHGKAILSAGYPFCSSSKDAFCTDTSSYSNFWSIDLICGKQISTPKGLDLNNTAEGKYNNIAYEVFPPKLQTAISNHTAKGGNILLSGANIGTDAWDSIYPIAKDSTANAAARKFILNTFGYKWMTNRASRTAEVKMKGRSFRFNNEMNSHIYSVESPDGISPASSGAESIMRYSDSGIDAAVKFDSGKYRAVSIGFPIETITDEASINEIIKRTINFFRK